MFVNVCVFFMQNFCLMLLTFRVTVTPLTFCVSRDLKFSLNHNFKQLNSIGGNLILKVKWTARRNWCHFLTLSLKWYIITSNVIWSPLLNFLVPFRLLTPPPPPTESGCNWLELPLVVREQFFWRLVGYV